jgi:muconolactone delta-isomerase
MFIKYNYKSIYIGGKMKFLVIAKNKYPLPPEAIPSLMDGAIAWKRKYEGKFEQIFAFAGMQAGGGITDVDSTEELDTIIAELPMAPFSDIEIYPLTDVEGVWQRSKQIAEAMSRGGKR